MKKLLVIIPLIFFLTVSCLWDDDTLEDEFRKFPRLLEVVIGDSEKVEDIINSVC